MPQVDKDKLRTRFRGLDEDGLFGLVDRAIDLLAPATLRKWVVPFFSMEDLTPDEVEEETETDVRKAVQGCRRSLPSYARCLAATTTPDDYATNVLRVVDGFVHDDRERCRTAARKPAGKEQKEALDNAQ